MSLLASSPYLHFILRWGRGGLREHLRGDPPVALLLCHMWVLSFIKLGGEVDGRIEGIVAGLSRLVMGIPPPKKEGCLSASFRSESSSPGRAISYPWRAIFRGCIMQGRKTAKGPKNRIENRSHHHHHQL